jgi:hypothetical protein
LSESKRAQYIKPGDRVYAMPPDKSKLMSLLVLEIRWSSQADRWRCFGVFDDGSEGEVRFKHNQVTQVE